MVAAGRAEPGARPSCTELTGMCLACQDGPTHARAVAALMAAYALPRPNSVSSVILPGSGRVSSEPPCRRPRDDERLQVVLALLLVELPLLLRRGVLYCW